jgi:hypothetical protein
MRDSVHNAGATLQSRDIPHTLPSPILHGRAPDIHKIKLKSTKAKCICFSDSH